MNTKILGRIGRMGRSIMLALAVLSAIAPYLLAQTSSGPVAPAAPGQLFTQNPDGTFSPVTLQTNAAGQPFLSGPLMEIFSTLGTATNWGVATFGIYMPSAGREKAAYGWGALALYNFNNYMGGGIGIDMLNNQVTMPSAQFQLQAPLRIGGTNGVTITPIAFTGVATPVGGSGNDNGSVVGLFGAGLDVKLWKGLGAFYAIEERTGQPRPWNLFGLRWAANF